MYSIYPPPPHCPPPEPISKIVFKKILFFIFVILIGTAYMIKDMPGNNIWEKMTNYSKKMQLELKQQKE